MSNEASIVEYYAENEGYKCGYCKSPNSNYSHGMWAHGLTVEDYQGLVDRGWRRSGCYCYKPTLHRTCCPMYTIKCSALDFKLSKSQKKKLKRFHSYLVHGKKKATVNDDGTNDSPSDVESGDDVAPDFGLCDFPGLKEKAERAILNVGSAIINSVEASFRDRLKDDVSDDVSGKGIESPSTSNVSASNTGVGVSTMQEEVEESQKPCVKKSTRPGDGRDPNRPQCKKAKLLRQERKEKKLAQLSSVPVDTQKTKTPPLAKSLEDFINEPLPDSPAHRLEIKLVNVASFEMRRTLDNSWALFAKYQMAIHREESDECDMSTYTNFLVNSPLKPWKPNNGPPQGYGSFHQQYWLDGRLIAVGVIDILPLCISSVYFFYDPEFHFLVLGTYASLREIAFCRSLHHSAPSLKYYYMGFYIHSCPKMRYKGAFSPSFLLCPEAYSWHPIESCIPLLEKNKYSRFDQDQTAKDPDQVVSVYNVSVLFQNEVMHYKTFLSHKPTITHLEEVLQYANLVGNTLSMRMLLILM